MEYIVIFDGSTKGHTVLETDSWFLEKFSSYESAKQVAEEWKEAGDCREYAIYGLCTDKRNHIM